MLGEKELRNPYLGIIVGVNNPRLLQARRSQSCKLRNSQDEKLISKFNEELTRKLAAQSRWG